MSGLRAYQIYLALKLHFTSEKYDFFKYGAMTKVSAESFSARRDKYFFEKVSKNLSEENLIQFFVANFVVNPKIWVGSMNDENYAEWKRKTDALEYNFKQDCKRLANMVDGRGLEVFTHSGEWGKPIFMTAVLEGDMSPETFLIFESELCLLDHFAKAFPDDLVWASKAFNLKKYKPFILQLIQDDSAKYRRIIREVLLSDDD